MFHNNCPTTGQIITGALSVLHQMDTDFTTSEEIPAHSQNFIMNPAIEPTQQTASQQPTGTASSTHHQPQVPVQQNKRSCDFEAGSSENKRYSGESARESENQSAVSFQSGSSQGSSSISGAINSTGSLQDYYQVTVSNRFADLNNEQSLDDSPVEVSKIPPIYLYSDENSTFSNLIVTLKLIAKSNFTTELKSNKLKIQMTSIADYRAVVKNLFDNKRQFHTYADPNNKQFSVVIKNVLTEITENEILSELKLKFNSVKKVTRLLKNGSPIPVVAVEFSGAHPIENILQIDTLCHLKVKVEKRKRHYGPLQCVRCQDYGHSKNSCNRKVTCAHCAGNHSSSVCKSSSVPVCINCKGNHRADVRSSLCSYYTKVLESKTKNWNRANERTNFSNPPVQSPSNNAVNFPSLPKANQIPHFSPSPSPLPPLSPSPSTSYAHIGNQHSTPTQPSTTDPTNPFLNNIIQAVNTHITNFLHSLIPIVLSKIQNFITSLFANVANATP